MTKTVALGFWAGVVLLAAGCSDGEQPPLGSDAIEQPEGFPFVIAAVALSDLCPGTLASSCTLAKHPPRGATTVDMTQPEPGRLCMKGHVGAGGWASFLMSLTEYGYDEESNTVSVEKSFDADALGATQLSFTLDSPPTGGVYIGAAIIKQQECEGPTPGGCGTGGFRLMTEAGGDAPLTFKRSGPGLAPFEDFVQIFDEETDDFDTTKLSVLAFEIFDGDYDFCVSDFRFLDAEGNEVPPT